MAGLNKRQEKQSWGKVFEVDVDNCHDAALFQYWWEQGE